jgi:hypothetical protein
MGDSILMMVECKSKDGENEANEEEMEKFSVHQSI